MTFIATRSVPLSAKTAAALKEHGAIFPRRDRSSEFLRALCERKEPEFLWNLGAYLDTSNIPVPVITPTETVRMFRGSAITRQWLGDLMPPQTGETEYVWLKQHGRHGSNKRKVLTASIDLSTAGYWEDNIEGQEYRIITVGDKIVQQFKREGDNAERVYTWLRMRDLPEESKGSVREGITKLRDSIQHNSINVIAWDVAQLNGGPSFIFEGNTSPGLNTHTVRRITEQIRRINAE